MRVSRVSRFSRSVKQLPAIKLFNRPLSVLTIQDEDDIDKISYLSCAMIGSSYMFFSAPDFEVGALFAIFPGLPVGTLVGMGLSRIYISAHNVIARRNKKD